MLYAQRHNGLHNKLKCVYQQQLIVCAKTKQVCNITKGYLLAELI